MKKIWLYSAIVSSAVFLLFFVIDNYNSGLTNYYLLVISLLCAVFVKVQLDDRHYYYEVNRLLYDLVLIDLVINAVIALYFKYGSWNHLDDLAFLAIYALQGIIVIMALSKLYLKVSGEWINGRLAFDFIFQILYFLAISTTIIIHFYGAVWSIARISLTVFYIAVAVTNFLVLLALIGLNVNSLKYRFNAYILCGSIYIATLLCYFLMYLKRVDLFLFQFFSLASLLAVALSVAFYRYIDCRYNCEMESKYDVGAFRSINYTWIIMTFLVAAYLTKLIYLYQLMLFLAVMTVYQYAAFSWQNRVQKRQLSTRRREIEQNLESTDDTGYRKLAKVNTTLKQSIQYDALTGLLNRRYFNRLIDGKVQIGKPFTLFYIDLDHFKIINDIYGHVVGDEVLVTLSNRFEALKSNDVIMARLGGDEFALILDAIDRESSDLFCARITEIVGVPIVVKGLTLSVGVSIGVTRFPSDAMSSEALLKNADTAMYQVKALQTAKRCIYYSDQLIERVNRQNEIDLLLKKLDFDNNFSISYKPIFALNSAKINGVQAHIALSNEMLGSIDTYDFVPIAEKNGTIHEISDWFFMNAVSQTKIWSQAYGNDLELHVLISRAIFDRRQFLTSFMRIVEHLDIDTSLITIELMSHQLALYSDYAVGVIKSLHDMGVNISLYGLGSSPVALKCLTMYDITGVKIDREIISGIADGERQRQIVSSIISLAEGMGLNVVAGGIMNDAQVSALKELKSSCLQQYAFGEYIDTEKFEERYLFQGAM